MATLTVENYVKTVFKLCARDERHQATTGQLSQELQVSPGTVTSMLKALSQQGLATYTPYEGVRLTAHGETLALRVLRRHRLIELFLCRVLHMDWDEVHEDAEQMEHVISDRLVARIDAYLEFPSFDPHGDPIPAADGAMPSHATQPLESLLAGRHFRIARVIDQSSDFLRFLSENGLALGTEGTVLANGPEIGKMTVQVNSRDITLPHLVADRLMVTPQPGAQ